MQGFDKLMESHRAEFARLAGGGRWECVESFSMAGSML
jgi:hypothetical protein